MNDNKCATCEHSMTWPHYPPSFRVCRHPAALKQHGGPRSCEDIVRKDRGACGPDAKLWARPKVDALEEDE